MRDCHVESLLIGGFAVNYYGYSRQTIDIDFMVATSEVETMTRAMTGVGFTSYIVRPTVLFFQKPGNPVRIDCLRVGTETLVKLMRSAVDANILGHDVKVPSLNDLLAMKFHSFFQSAMQRDKDLMDIVALSMIHRLDPETVLHPLAQKFASEDIFRHVCARMQSTTI